jgi:enamine deaminase RidA (YjgF/YER057c/UK114 family)
MAAGGLASARFLGDTASPGHGEEKRDMANDIEARLKALGVILPVPGTPAANYIPTVASGRTLYVSGQIPITPEGVKFVGKVGREYSIDEGREAARLCAINVLANIKAGIGDLEKISRFLKVVGFVNAVPEFQDAHLVVNGASDFFVEVLGDRGRHARSAIGVGTLPRGLAVEVEAIVETV